MDRIKLILVLIIVGIIILIFLYPKKITKNSYTSNSVVKDDKYVDGWNNKLFLPVCDKKINYLVS